MIPISAYFPVRDRVPPTRMGFLPPGSVAKEVPVATRHAASVRNNLNQLIGLDMSCSFRHSGSWLLKDLTLYVSTVRPAFFKGSGTLFSWQDDGASGVGGERDSYCGGAGSKVQ